MRRLPGVGIVAAGAVAAMVVMSGCSDGGTSEAGKAGTASAAGTAAASSSPPAAATPEEKFNELVQGTSYYFEGQGTGSSADAMKRYCDLLGEKELDGVPPAQWLAERELTKQDGETVLEEGVTEFCPAQAKTLKAAVEGTYERWFADGTYEVGSGAGQMPAGAYRTTGALRECYWERTSRSGKVLDNAFATSAQEVRVTVRSGDGQFTTRSCGSWQPVK
ncbi:hypothetical protein HUT19_42155 (plasmid) [Streptomyces sp. NA02950]|uniref:hypothetical protein n=1 Tax=Streptomyces sp. NA02950 TaxID=2742137 RepID=UPI00159017B4|nr:hypothetical protein [Streptomyces sp. NA02950]QKV98322.1 hypothetical protein HUT19_42155 [Streptomyces sp. NA02950]